ncbi:MAG: YabP/YqfC family sporulation protein [Clostridia bacterium]|nr:YabP/YqfC family sporulation protein [Clostridia bacterium]
MAGFLPEEIRTGKMRVVLVGNGEALVEQHRGLISYETEEIVFRMLKGQVRLQGEGMVIASFGAMDARVEGKIKGVFLEAEA